MGRWEYVRWNPALAKRYEEKLILNGSWSKGCGGWIEDEMDDEGRFTSHMGVVENLRDSG